MGGFVIASMIGVCAIGLETCMWMGDHIRHEKNEEELHKSNSELKRAVISLVEEKKELARRLDGSRSANQAMRKRLDDAMRKLDARGIE